MNNTYDGIESNNLINEENRRLKAENNVLQKKLSGRKNNISFQKHKQIFFFCFLKELSTKIIESISTASSSNESFQKEDVEVECDDNRYLSCFLLLSNL